MAISTKALAMGLVIGLVIGLVAGYFVTVLERRISDLEKQVGLQSQITDLQNQLKDRDNTIQSLQIQIVELQKLIPIMPSNATLSGITLIEIKSESMEPTLNIGDIIIVRVGIPPCNITADWPPNGDIIVFHKPGEYETLIVHRAVQKENYDGTCRFRTRGDHNPSVDPWWVEENEIVGKVIAIYRYIEL